MSSLTWIVIVVLIIIALAFGFNYKANLTGLATGLNNITELITNITINSNVTSVNGFGGRVNISGSSMINVTNETDRILLTFNNRSLENLQQKVDSLSVSNVGWKTTNTVVYNDTPGVTVGIGTQNAIEKLTVSGNIYASGFVNQSVMWLWNSIGSIKGDTTGFFGQKQILDNNAIAMTIKGHTGGDYDQIEAGKGGTLNLIAGDGGNNNAGGSAGDGGDTEIAGGNAGIGDGVLEIGGDLYMHGGDGARQGNIIMGLDTFANQIGLVGIRTTSPTAVLTVIGTYRGEGGNYNIRTINGFNLSDQSDATTAITFRNKTGFTIFDVDTFNKRIGINRITPRVDLDINGSVIIGSSMKSAHLEFNGTAPAVSSCGAGATIKGNDNTGEVIIGSTNPTTNCIITFAAVWTNNASCFVNDETRGVVAGRTVVANTTGVVITTSSTMHNDHVDYFCTGYR